MQSDLKGDYIELHLALSGKRPVSIAEDTLLERLGRCGYAQVVETWTPPSAVSEYATSLPTSYPLLQVTENGWCIAPLSKQIEAVQYCLGSENKACYSFLQIGSKQHRRIEEVVYSNQVELTKRNEPFQGKKAGFMFVKVPSKKDSPTILQNYGDVGGPYTVLPLQQAEISEDADTAYGLLFGGDFVDETPLISSIHVPGGIGSIEGGYVFDKNFNLAGTIIETKPCEEGTLFSFVKFEEFKTQFLSKLQLMMR